MSAWESTSEKIDLVCAAFVAALGELEDVVKDRTADTGSYRYSYADLATATGMARPILAEYGIAVTQSATVAGRDVLVSTTIVHTSGQWLAYPALAMPGGNTAQQAGSALTYGRRYSLMTILGLATEDDDGAGAGTRQDAPQRAPEPTYSPETTAVMAEVAALAGTDTARHIKAWANGRKLTLDAFEADPEWRGEVCNWLDEAKAAGVREGADT